jgi:hypothetical protein
VRTRLAEIPELGITAQGSYALQAGTSISEMFQDVAGAAFSSLLTLVICSFCT